MDNYIRRLTVKSLFNHNNDLVIDFNEKINCLYGVNGSGKTTIINLLVASVFCDLTRLANLSFHKATIYISLAGKRRAKPFFDVIKTDSGIDYSFYSEFSDPSEQYFHFPSSIKREIDRLEEMKRNTVTDIIKRYVTTTYVPLSRMHDNDLYENNPRGADDYFLNIAMRARHIPPEEVENLLDPSKRMLLKLEESFKLKYSETQKEINKDLDTLKDTILEKMLLNNDFANKYARQTISLKKKLSNPDYEEYSKKLRAANLRISDSALKEHFEVMEKNISDLNRIRDQYQEEANHENSDTSKLAELQKEYHREATKYRALTPFYERFFDVLEDVENIQIKKEESLKPFTNTSKLINDFLTNKEFSFNSIGGFQIKCGAREIKLTELSSGEKHLVALLGRVALSPEQGAVFVADEPELSLHLEWQRKILPAIQSLSPGIQIIVATHSPAIVPEGALLIDLEECVR
jgi:predicted ATPase